MTELTEHPRRLKAEFIEAHCAFFPTACRAGPLEPEVKGMTYTPTGVATPHRHLPGTRLHMENALKHGADTMKTAAD